MEKGIMDKRNSKKAMLTKIAELEIKLVKVYDAGVWGIGHVGEANYQHREDRANELLDKAMYKTKT